ncbi:hypothetical protein V2J09_006960 [Rumex salicifolius]
MDIASNKPSSHVWWDLYNPGCKLSACRFCLEWQAICSHVSSNDSPRPHICLSLWIFIIDFGQYHLQVSQSGRIEDDMIPKLGFEYLVHCKMFVFSNG